MYLSRVSGKHIGETLSALGFNRLSVKTLTGACTSSYSGKLHCLHESKQFNAVEYDTHHHFTAVCLYIRIDDEPANAPDYMTYSTTHDHNTKEK